MSDISTGMEVYVVVDSFIDGGRPEGIVHGVYSSEKTARTAAYHPHSSLKVLKLYLNDTPVDEAEDIDKPKESSNE